MPPVEHIGRAGKKNHNVGDPRLGLTSQLQIMMGRNREEKLSGVGWVIDGVMKTFLF